jgi:hypothetical protein
MSSVRRLRHVLIFFIAVAMPRTVVARQVSISPQTYDSTETNRAPIIPFLEGTDVFWTLVKKDALDGHTVFWPNKLEANIFPHLILYQNFTDVLNVDDQDQRASGQRGQNGIKRTAMVFSGTPAVRLRMLRDRSAPVRTPSYMPRGNFQFLWVRGLEDGTAVPERGKTRSVGQFLEQLKRVPRIGIWEFHVIGGHHSNGQDGCLSTEQTLVPPPPAIDAVCIPPGLVPTAKTMNRINGSFSSAFFFRFGGNYSRNWMGPKTSASTSELPEANREARLSAEYEWHPRPLVDEQMRDIYGRHRVNLGAAYATKVIRGCRRRFEVSTGAVWNPTVIDPELDWSGHAQATCFPWMNGGWGFLVRWYAGQDYYNVGFLDDINRLQVGVTFNQADFFRFRSRSTAKPGK